MSTLEGVGIRAVAEALESSGVWSLLIPTLFIGSVQHPRSECRKEGIEKRVLEGVVQ